MKKIKKISFFVLCFFLLGITTVRAETTDNMKNIKKIEKGDTAPDFTLSDQNGKPVTLSDLTKKGGVVLYFYPKDETPGCTKEACAFRDSYDVFKKAGAEVVGVSSDSTASHAAFAQNHRLPFVLLSDPKEDVRKLFGVPSTMGLFPGRVTYVIDRNGIVQLVFNSQFKAEQHIEEALQVIKKL